MACAPNKKMLLPDGRTLCYLECGAPDGHPVICFHGYPGCRLEYAGYDSWAGRNHLRILAVDRPGFGGSTPQPNRTLRDICADVRQLCRQLRLESVAAYGVSGGGPYAFVCAALMPELVRGAVLVGGLGELEREDAIEGMNLANKSMFSLARVYPKAAELSLKGTHWLTTKHPGLYYKMLKRVLPKEDRERIGTVDEQRANAICRENEEVFRQGARYVGQETILFTKPWGIDFSKVRVPIHFWHGEQDKNVPIRMAKELNAKIATGVPHFFAQEGHMLTGRHMQEICKCLKDLFPAPAVRPAVDTSKQEAYNRTNQTRKDETMSEYHINTKCVQAGYAPKNGEPRVPPIVQSTTYKYETSEEMGKLFDLEANGFFYTRLANPTLDAVERKIAALEGGVGAMVTSAGQAASFISVTNICRAGGHVVCASAVYGGTFNLFHKTLRELGVEVTFTPPLVTEEELNAAFQDNTRCVFIETLSNPSLVVADIALYAKAAHAHGVPLIVDNTFPTPVNCRPFEFGADIVTHSTSKYMDGHAVALGGVIVDGGRFDWANGKFPELTEPDESYHGVRYVERFGNAAYITKARVHLMRDLGAQMSPQNAFLLNMGLETLFLRMERHCANALEVAKFLEKSDKIASVSYPGLPSSPYYELAQKYMPNGTCGVISFEVKGGREATIRLTNQLKLAAIVTHVADTRTCVLHPASTTHRQMNEEQLKEAGVGAGLIRMSVGIEYVGDIIADLEQALAAI